jgi:uncharacterized BrkB/YihY/UPF0761 family membrane protein
MTGRRHRMRERRERLEAMLATGQARLERARSRSLVVDTMVGVVRRERPVAVGILAGSLAFRLFALMIPLTYVLVAGLGFAAEAAAEEASPRVGDRLGDLLVASVAAATRTSDRGRWLALILGGAATLWAAAAVLEVLRWVHLLAWRLPPTRSRVSPWLVLGLVAGAAALGATSAFAEQFRADAKGLASELTVLLLSAGVQGVVLAVLWLALSWTMPRPSAVPWTALVPGALLFAVGFLGFTLAVSLYFAPRAARASTVYGSLGLALVLLVSLFLFARLAVAAAELNATLWERRRPAGTGG